MMRNNATIGITGGIGAGKSIISRILRCNGFEVYDCDSKAKQLMQTDNTLKEKLKSLFGDDIYNPPNCLNKKYLAKIIFTDESARAKVNSIVHEVVRNDIRIEREKAGKVFFIESAILASSGLDSFCDSVWMVEAPESLRIERTQKRDNISQEDIINRIQSQQYEMALLNHDKIIILDNDDCHPLLSEVLALTNKNNNNQTYTLSC